MMRMQHWESEQLLEASYIKDLGDDLIIIHLKLGDASSARRRRDLVVYERRQAMDDGTLVVAVASLPKEIAAGLLPPRAVNKSLARGLLLQSGWVVEKLDDDDDGNGSSSSCVVTYVVQLDPAAAGWMPQCIVSRLNNKLVMIIDKMWRIAQITMPPATGCKAANEV
jgi:hypothetical protein